MRRLSNLIPEICDRENIEISIRQVLRGSERKQRVTGKYILEHKEEVINDVIQKISSGTFRLGSFIQTEVTDGPKRRRIQIIPLKDRLVVNAIMRVLEAHLVKRMIFTTASSIKGRGCCYLKKIIERDIKKDDKGTKYVYKIDITKYYDHIDHALMKQCIRHFIKDVVLLPILDNFIDMLPEGLSIGLRSSQVFGNLFLSWLVDHKLKTQYRVKYYYRYCDDLTVLGPSKQYLWTIHNLLSSLLKGTGLTIKSNYRVFARNLGIDYLGYVIYTYKYSKLRKRIKKNAAKKLAHIHSQQRRNEVINSLKGYCSHSKGKTLFNKLVNTFKK